MCIGGHTKEEVCMRNEPFIQSTNSLLILDVFPFHKESRLVAGMTTRCGGTSGFPYDSLNMAYYTDDDEEMVQANRQMIADQVGFPLSSWVDAEQVHGCEVKKVNSPSTRGIGKADAIYTTEKNVLLTSYYADCVPMFFYAPNQSAVGLLHAGWKGTALNIGAELLREWKKRENIAPEDVYVVIGPAISKEAYEVDQRVIDKMKKILPEEAKKPWYTKSDGRFQLDLKQMNAHLLEEAGILTNHISVSRHCTYEEEQLFFSYRRDKGVTGRMMTFIGMK